MREDGTEAAVSSLVPSTDSRCRRDDDGAEHAETACFCFEPPMHECALTGSLQWPCADAHSVIHLVLLHTGAPDSSATAGGEGALIAARSDTIVVGDQLPLRSNRLARQLDPGVHSHHGVGLRRWRPAPGWHLGHAQRSRRC